MYGKLLGGRAFEFFGGVPNRISYDNSKVLVIKIIGAPGVKRVYFLIPGIIWPYWRQNPAR